MCHAWHTPGWTFRPSERSLSATWTTDKSAHSLDFIFFFSNVPSNVQCQADIGAGKLSAIFPALLAQIGKWLVLGVQRRGVAGYETKRLMEEGVSCDSEPNEDHF